MYSSVNILNQFEVSPSSLKGVSHGTILVYVISEYSSRHTTNTRFMSVVLFFLNTVFSELFSSLFSKLLIILNW